MSKHRRVILWRHGRTEWNVAGRVQGQSDIPLDEVGILQAKAGAARLASLEPSRIITSDLQRAAATAAELGKLVGITPEADPRFRELNFGVREGLTWKQAWERFPEAMQAWIDGDESQVSGAETYRQAGDRFAAALREEVQHLGRGQTLVVVAHGAVLRTGTGSFLGYPLESWKLFGGLSNCHWAVMEEWGSAERSAWRLVEWNAGSLPESVLGDDAMTPMPVSQGMGHQERPDFGAPPTTG